ncbi:carbon-nitrogen hydrolase family protein [Phytoactinopolyspora endophytica]|uniref:carbon-nitrogen hydrolase family protein n=1 Tax=Phytoactinopolyspora endophytica TaxID=1642495 RepID=UPI00101D43FE|nr:carbon-nitrogen hydrolase family protein [Phytoactinopolyspora endophytica]
MAAIRIAVAQGVGTQTPDGVSIREQGRQVRDLMASAADGGARLILFTEGALSAYPHKRLMSHDPDRVAESDWSRADWAVLEEELAATVKHAGDVGLWAVVGSVHLVAERERPFNSLYVISETGHLVGRYDKRYLSPTESTFMYAAGDHPTVFEVDGFRFGCASCIEANMPEVFIEYEALGTDCVLLASYDDRPAEPLGDSRSMAHALLTGMWIAFAAPGVASGAAVSCVASPDDRWLVRGRPDGTPQVLFADLDPEDPAMRAGYDRGYRPWRVCIRNGYCPTPDEITALQESSKPGVATPP